MGVRSCRGREGGGREAEEWLLNSLESAAFPPLVICKNNLEHGIKILMLASAPHPAPNSDCWSKA